MPRTPDDFRVGERVDASFFQREARAVARDLVGTLLLNHASDASGDAGGGVDGDMDGGVDGDMDGGVDGDMDGDADGDPGSGADGDADAGPVGGLVVETEAYVNAVDPACHLAAGRTQRTESFYSGPGTVYVYSIHGHAALNFITATDGHPEGVLVRAVEPTHGVDAMRARRGYDDPERLASGPGKLTESLGVTKHGYDDRPLAETPLAVHRTDWTPDVDVTGRVGVTSAADWPLRYVAAGSDFVSSPPPAVDLDFDAVDAAYARLHADADLPTVDDA